jgi:Ca2+-binding RTX toxin-like protein
MDGADSILGDDGDDWIEGGNGDDPLLRGGNGNDYISGGAGKDRLLGDGGAANVAYRDTSDLLVTGFLAANTFLVPPNANVVQIKLDNLIDRIWQDHYLAPPNGNEDLSLDTLDELFKSLLP